VKLTLSELILLRLLVDEQGHPIQKQDMSRKVLGHGVEDGSRALDVMVSKLRRKLSDVESQISIQSVRSMGYMAQVNIPQS
jgi:DNA-binding response OmpR family regulator